MEGAMSTKHIHIGHAASGVPRRHLTWVTQLLVTVIVLALLGIAYALWQVSQVEAPLPEVPVLPLPERLDE